MTDIPYDRFIEFDGHCPDCGQGDEWGLGPQGGARINLRCTQCDTWLNVTMVAHPALPVLARRIRKEE